MRDAIRIKSQSSKHTIILVPLKHCKRLTPVSHPGAMNSTVLLHFNATRGVSASVR